MAINAITKIKVDKALQPIHSKERKAPPLHIGGHYFVSFGSNVAYGCILREVIEMDGYPTKVLIDIPIKPKSKKGHVAADGSITNDWFDSHTLYADEIGTSPEEAVINAMTS